MALLVQGGRLIIKEGKLVVDDTAPSPCCCGTCNDFPHCLSCDDGTWVPMKLTITLSGAAGTEGTCDCPETNHDKRRILWDNLNSTFQLEQEAAGSPCFKLDLIADCSEARDGDAILIEDDEFGCCTDESGGYELRSRSEVYVSSISVCLECTQNKMRVATISFNVCGCEQHVVGPPPLSWSDWSCAPLPYPLLVCELGNDLQTAVPCTRQTMERELLWARPTPNAAHPCSFSFPCDVPVIGQITAHLTC